MSIRRSIRVATLAAVGIISLSFACTASAASGAATERNKRLVAEGFAHWSAGTGGVFDLLAPDAEWTIVGTSPAAKTYASKEAFLAEVIRPFNARLSTPFKPTVRALYADGDTVIALWDGEGTAKDGKPYRNTYTCYLTFRGDQVVRAIAFFDTVAFNDLWSRVAA